MQRPPKIPANPSFVELDEDENAVEKFKTAVSSISNILTLDRLKQVCCVCVRVWLMPVPIGGGPQGEAGQQGCCLEEEGQRYASKRLSSCHGT